MFKLETVRTVQSKRSITEIAYNESEYNETFLQYKIQ